LGAAGFVRWPGGDWSKYNKPHADFVQSVFDCLPGC
jgi:hypothetical protein